MNSHGPCGILAVALICLSVLIGTNGVEISLLEDKLSDSSSVGAHHNEQLQRPHDTAEIADTGTDASLDPNFEDGADSSNHISNSGSDDTTRRQLAEDEIINPEEAAGAMPNTVSEKRRKGKFFGNSFRFGFMKWVNIPAEECASNRDNMTGVCTSYKECKINNGSIEGTCFGGFGACCVYRKSCGDALAAKVGYFESPGDFANAGSPCILHVQKYDLAFASGAGKRRKRQIGGLGGMTSTICQFRLDFDEMVLAQPTNQSVCETDVFVVSGTTSSNPPPICGTNSGQSMYLDMDGTNSPARLTIVRNGQFSGRNFRIKITQIECWSQERAPRGCLQYYTGIGGRIMSFNFFFPVDTTNVRQLANQDYNICIRRAEGFCSTCFTQCADPQNSSPTTSSMTFSLSSPSAGLLRAVSGDAVGKCRSDWLVISCASNSSDTNPFATCSDRFCGELFGLDGQTVSGRLCTTDTTLRYITDESESDTTQEATTGKRDQGFCLQYTQQTCN